MMGIFPPEGGLKRVGERFVGGLVFIIGGLLMIVTRELDKGLGIGCQGNQGNSRNYTLFPLIPRTSCFTLQGLHWTFGYQK